ncbi:MAG: hypothetical protein A2Y54_04015 [Chloroflexi bacterium RBG_16_51_16]|nr:MAG: hypothetical protein A2Y54_04015 [Chloroflexi bacterium RBG_16_51_16]
MNFKKSITLVVLVLLLGSCSAGGPTEHIKVSMTDFTYNPNSFTVQAGKEIKLDIANNGAIVHNFLIMNAGSDIGQDFDQEDEKNVYWKIDLGPGQSTTTSFTAPPEPGEYLIVCSTAGHYIAGMIGKLHVLP